MSCKDPEEAKKKLDQLAAGKYGIIYITEAVAAELKEEIEKYQEQVLPAIIQIPGVSGNTGAGIEGVKRPWSRRSVQIFCSVMSKLGRIELRRQKPNEYRHN